METSPNKLLILSGQEIRCIPALPPGVMFDLADLTSETDPMRSLSAIRRFLYAIVIPEDEAALKAVLYDRENVLDLTVLSEKAGDLIREYAGRPTLRPSASPSGSDITGLPSRVVSFSRGTVEQAPASSTDGASTAS